MVTSSQHSPAQGGTVQETPYATAPGSPTLSFHDPELVRKAQAFKRVCVMGLGYVGLPTALLFARHGLTVHGVDISPRVIDNIRHDKIADAYPELAEWWHSVKALPTFSADVKPIPSDLFLITVPTPVHPQTKHCDLSAVVSAMEAIVPVLRPGNMVVLESTVPPGTTRNMLKPMIERAGFTVGEDLHLCFSPERILPGNTVQELVHNHRVLGGTTPESARLAATILRQVVSGEIYVTDDMTAEFCKLAENTYRDVNIALANELSIIADQHGIDIKEAIPLINMHPRVNLLQPGIGVGGHCIAVDPWFFVELSPDKTELIGTSRRVNDKMPDYCAGKIMQDLADIENPRICAVGLTYKPDVADTRESPAGRIVEVLREHGHDVTTFDPLLSEYQGMTLADAVEGADYLAILVNHAVVKAELSLNREKILARMRTPRLRIF
jgi:UDP-N-acetyl-D-mannosaminuronic acid dehydrogenase